MANVSVAVLGLGRIGASVVLALKRYNERKDSKHHFDVVGADMRTGVRDDAAKAGITDKIERDLFTAAARKDIVVLALPLAEMQEAYKAIASDLRAGAVVLDMSLLKQQSLAWAGKHLSKEVHMVGLTPIINPKYLHDGLDDTAHAAADLFDKGSMLLMPSTSCAKEAVELSSDFANILGAVPHFYDPAEHDGIVALTEGMPALLGLASFYTASQAAGWVDSQRVTNPAFGRLTHHLYDTHPDDLRDLILNNRDSILRQTDELLVTLKALREIIAENDQDSLEEALTTAADSYNTWINKRSNGKWDDSKDDSSNPSFGGNLVSGLMGGFLSKKLSGNKGDK
ncbi:MAG: prephenate dehydrogenase/arogenate dehydrogenase family protein [Chloroflexi bacterium]|nr:prephenate dehydrogenase/arogenate dehydrogenase family protein [Chloroflexota bacterium]MCC6892390.1 prephenate dehydrogenase [Anaerolineae bacterium]